MSTVKRQEQIIQGSKKLWDLLIIIIITDHYQQIELQHYLRTQKYLLQKLYVFFVKKSVNYMEYVVDSSLAKCY